MGQAPRAIDLPNFYTKIMGKETIATRIGERLLESCLTIYLES